MNKDLLIFGQDRRSPRELEEVAEGVINKVSNTGSQVALVSESRTVAYAMLPKLLNEGVNVQGLLLKDKKKFRLDHVRSYTNPDSIAEGLASLYKKGIEYFIVMAMNSLIPAQVVDGYHGILLNVHGSVLPEFLGAGNPVKKQLRLGEEYGGVTLQYVGVDLDGGDVLVRYKVKLIYGDQSPPLEGDLDKLADKNYRKVIFPTAAKVCAFALDNIHRIEPRPVLSLRSGRLLKPDKMVYARK